MTVLTQLWVGTDSIVRQRICEALDKARIGYVEEPIQEISSAADRLLPFPVGFFPFAVLVQPADLLPAHGVLEDVLGLEGKRLSSVDENEPSATELPVPEATIAADGNKDSSDVEVWSGNDKDKAQFVAAALREVEIENRLKQDDSGFTIFVAARELARAKQVVAQVAEGSLPTENLEIDDPKWVDTPPRSYLLAWLLPLLSLFLFVLAPSLSQPDRSPILAVAFSLGIFVVDLGALWMLYQAIRYEVRPLSYCLIALFPFTFIWYYIERYSQRRGPKRLPISVRMRA